MLKWTTDKPKEIGWYWHRPEPGIIPEMVFVCWRYAPNKKPQWCIIRPCDCEKWYETCTGEWAGPIPQPEENE